MMSEVTSRWHSINTVGLSAFSRYTITSCNTRPCVRQTFSITAQHKRINFNTIRLDRFCQTLLQCCYSFGFLYKFFFSFNWTQIKLSLKFRLFLFKSM